MDNKQDFLIELPLLKMMGLDLSEIWSGDEQEIGKLIKCLIILFIMGNCKDKANVLEGLGSQQDQSHLMNHWKNLPSNDKRRTFQQQLTKLNVNEIRKMYKKSSRSSQSKPNELSSSTQSERASGVSQYRSLPDNKIVRKQEILEQKLQLDKIGLQAIAKGQVAAFIMAGNQSPQLSIESSIGTYDIGLDSACSIFQILVRKLARLRIMSQANDDKKIKLYIMTSTENKNQIKAFFKSKDYFGYGPNNVFFFSQSVQPIVDQDGKIVLKSETNIYMSPRGNGMIYSEMKDKNLLSHLISQGIKYVFFGPVNNVLLKIADPCSLGYLIRQSNEVLATCIESNQDFLGHFGLTLDCKKIKVYEDNHYHPKKRWANTGACYMTLQFLDKLIKDEEFLTKMQSNYHDIAKQVATFNAKINTRVTTKCLFFQSFYHEAFEQTDKISIIEVDPVAEFAPIKNNGQQKYSITYAREAYWNWHKNLLAKNGIRFAGEGHVQLNPALTYQGQNIQQLIKCKQIKSQVKLPQYIY